MEDPKEHNLKIIRPFVKISSASSIVTLVLIVIFSGISWWLFASLIPLAIGGFIFLVTSSDRCKFCNAINATKLVSSRETGRHTEHREITREDPVYDKDGNQIGTSKRIEQVMELVTQHFNQWTCIVCEENWTSHTTDRSRNF